jgi:hypothetical protein
MKLKNINKWNDSFITDKFDNLTSYITFGVVGLIESVCLMFTVLNYKIHASTCGLVFADASIAVVVSHGDSLAAGRTSGYLL